nr:hypothetical protein [Streptomyces sabulosicollis]
MERDEIAIPPSAIASAIGYAIERSVGIGISEVVVRPTVRARQPAETTTSGAAGSGCLPSPVMTRLT